MLSSTRAACECFKLAKINREGKTLNVYANMYRTWQIEKSESDLGMFKNRFYINFNINHVSGNIFDLRDVVVLTRVDRAFMRQ